MYHVYGKAPTRQLQSMPVAVSGSGYTRKYNKYFDTVIRMQGSLPQKRFLIGCSSAFMRIAEHLSPLRAWCKKSLPGR